jgi:threonine dehydrogenase-like Zn-dependent dehydrogenase
MKAARYYGPKDIRVEQIPEPEAQQGQVKVKVSQLLSDCRVSD